MGVREIILVRHGQYANDPEQLTDLGRAQAEVVAARLAHRRVHTLVSSTMPRSRETADFIAQFHPKATRKAMRLLDERLTAPPRSGDPPWSRDKPEGFWEASRDVVERAYKRLFRPTKGEDRTEVYAIHGNMIRTLMLRATEFPLGAWAELWINHCSVTELEVHPDEGVRLVRFNDVGHLPPPMVTDH